MELEGKQVELLLSFVRCRAHWKLEARAISTLLLSNLTSTSFPRRTVTNYTELSSRLYTRILDEKWFAFPNMDLQPKAWVKKVHALLKKKLEVNHLSVNCIRLRLQVTLLYSFLYGICYITHISVGSSKVA